MGVKVGFVLIEPYSCNTKIFCYIVRVVNVVVSIALLVRVMIQDLVSLWQL